MPPVLNDVSFVPTFVVVSPRVPRLGGNLWREVYRRGDSLRSYHKQSVVDVLLYTQPRKIRDGIDSPIRDRALLWGAARDRRLEAESFLLSGALPMDPESRAHAVFFVLYIWRRVSVGNRMRNCCLFFGPRLAPPPPGPPAAVVGESQSSSRQPVPAGFRSCQG